MSFEEIVGRRTDGQWTNIDHNSSPSCSGELKIEIVKVSRL